MSAEIGLTSETSLQNTALSNTVMPAATGLRLWLGRASGLLAILCMCFSAHAFGWDNPDGTLVVPYESLNWFGFGVVALGLAIWLVRPQIKMLVHAKQAHVLRSRINLWITGLGILQLLALAEINGSLIFHDLLVSQHVQFLLFVGGIATLAAGLGGFRGISLVGLRQQRAVILCLLLLMLIGFGLRGWHLGSAVHIPIDEPNFSDSIVDLRGDEYAKILMPINDVVQFTRIFPYLQRWTVALLGPDLAGLRLPSVIFGTLTIAALYLLGEALFDTKLGLLAAALLTAFPPHIQFSRIGINNIADPLFGTLALAFLVRGLRRNSHADYVLAGICLGLCSYFYEGGRLLFTGLVILWLGAVLITHLRRIHWRGWLLMGFAAAIVILPYSYTLFSNRLDLTPRIRQAGSTFGNFIEDVKRTTLWDAIVKHYNDTVQHSLYHLVSLPDSSLYYGGKTGLLLQFVIPFFLLGLGFALWRLGSAGWLLIIWIEIGVIGTSFIDGPANSARFVVLFPALILIVAVGLRYPLELIGSVRLEAGLNLVMVVIVLIGGVAEVQYFFGEHLPVYNIQIRDGKHDFYNALDDAMHYPHARLYIISGEDVLTDTLTSLLAFRQSDFQFNVLTPDQATWETLESLPFDHTLIFAVVPEDTATIAQLQETFKLQGPFWSRTESVPREVQYALYTATSYNKLYVYRHDIGSVKGG